MRESEASFRFTVEAGRLVAGQVERSLQKAAFEVGLDLRLEKSSGWLDTLLMGTVTGSAREVEAFQRAFSRWVDALKVNQDA